MAEHIPGQEFEYVFSPTNFGTGVGSESESDCCAYDSIAVHNFGDDLMDRLE